MEKMTKCEEKIMNVIWASDHVMNLPEITQKVNKKYDLNWKSQTVSTFLSRLVKRGVIQSKRNGRTFLHYPIINQEEYTAFILKDMCDFWFKSNPSQMIKHVRKACS